MRFFRLSKLGLAALSLLALACGLVFAAHRVHATPVPHALQVAEPTATTETVESDAGVDASKTTATIVFMTAPYATAVVTWGRKPLGKILPGKPLVVVRPRDSGPLDVVVRARGYLPVQTRAHTFSDTRVIVKLTPLDKKSELLGYRLPIDAGVGDGAIEGGLLEAGLLPDASLPVVPPAPVPPIPTPQPVPAPVNVY